MLLNEVYDFLGRFVAYPSEHAQVAHTLWIAHTHRMDLWDSTPRIAFLSPEPASGKTRALEVTEPLVPRPVESVNATPAYLFRKVSDPEGAPTLLYDEIDTVFGPKAKDNEDVRGLLNAGHRRGAFAGRCVVRGKVIETEELPAYCAVALAGLNDLPDTIMSRAVVVRMAKRAPSEVIEEWRRRPQEAAAHELRDRLADWMATVSINSWPAMPTGVADRRADVWEALLVIADAAGGTWPERARVAAVADVADSMAGTPSRGVQLLADLRTVFGDRDAMSTEEILKGLCAIEESPWAAGLRGGKPLDARGLATRLRPYKVRSRNVRIGEATPKGYTREDLWDPWSRYLQPLSEMPKHGGEGWGSTDAHTQHSGSDASDGVVGVPPYGSATSATSATHVPEDWRSLIPEGAL